MSDFMDCVSCIHAFIPSNLNNLAVLACRHPESQKRGNPVCGNVKFDVDTPSWCPIAGADQPQPGTPPGV